MAKFQEVQEAYDKLVELHDAALVDKAALRELRLVAQKAYLELQQLDSFADTEWREVTNRQPFEPDQKKVQSFLAGASIVLGKWTKQLESFSAFHSRALELVTELAPPFEGQCSEQATAESRS
jgi:hypothetical protein